jgi:hypothetical protein
MQSTAAVCRVISEQDDRIAKLLALHDDDKTESGQDIVAQIEEKIRQPLPPLPFPGDGDPDHPPHASHLSRR